MNQNEMLIEIWKETRNTINHLDKMMDGIRVTTFTLFGVISSITAMLNYYAPHTIVLGIPSSALVELILIPVITVLFAQNRMYHFWLYNAIETATAIETILHDELKAKIKDRKLFITYSLTGIDKPRSGYWRSMRYSKIFWVDVSIYFTMIITCFVLAIIFRAGVVANPNHYV
jgi:hypothetical protein